PRPRPSLFPYTTLFRSPPPYSSPMLVRRTLAAAAVLPLALAIAACAPEDDSESTATDTTTQTADAEACATDALELRTPGQLTVGDRKSTRLNSSHVKTS